jgi:hypothetical protein
MVITYRTNYELTKAKQGNYKLWHSLLVYYSQQRN